MESVRCNVSAQLELVVFHLNVKATATVLVSGCFLLFPTSWCILFPILNSQEPFQIGLANCHRSAIAVSWTDLFIICCGADRRPSRGRCRVWWLLGVSSWPKGSVGPPCFSRDSMGGSFSPEGRARTTVDGILGERSRSWLTWESPLAGGWKSSVWESKVRRAVGQRRGPEPTPALEAGGSPRGSGWEAPAQRGGVSEARRGL